jgi:hypothetical protein
LAGLCAEQEFLGHESGDQASFPTKSLAIGMVAEPALHQAMLAFVNDLETESSLPGT